MQLAFAVIPLIHFVSDKEKMGEFAIKPILQISSWLIAIIISILNIKLVYDEVSNWITDLNSIWITILLISISAALLALLAITIIYPLISKKQFNHHHIHDSALNIEKLNTEPILFKTIVVALDFSTSDYKVLKYAKQLSKEQTKLVLVHVVENAQVKYTGEETNDAEAKSDMERLLKYAAYFNSIHHPTEVELAYNNRVQKIAAICKKYNANLLIVGSHGHKGVKDFVFGETINKLRHEVNIPVFIAQ